MAHRLSRIVTRTGDDGTTGLGDGSRHSKNTARIHALGEVDELNSVLGLLLCEALPETIRTSLVRMQHDLFDLGGELSIPGYELLSDAALAALELDIETGNGALPKLKEFILPGGSRAAAQAHVARTIARRAERSVVALAEAERDSPAPLRPLAQQYLNRASDWLFIVARLLNVEAGSGDVLWQRQRD